MLMKLADMGLMQHRGLSPKQAVDMIIAEAKARFPRADSVIVRKSEVHDGFDIVAL